MSLLLDGAPLAVLHDAPRLVWSHAGAAESPRTRAVPEETPVAFAYEGASYAVMMATPADLEDFAVGFSLNEEVVRSPSEIEEINILPTEDGILLRMALSDRPADAFWERRRYLAGPSGCGLCGIESLAQSARQPRRVTAGIEVSGAAILDAMAELPAHQTLNHLTGALHAAAFWSPDTGIAV